MLQTLKNFWSGFKSALNNVVMAVAIPIVIIFCDWAGLVTGGLLGMAVLSGVMLVLSILFILLGMPAKGRKQVTYLLARQGFWVDLVLTVVLMVGGFSMGATMGLVAMMLGLNFSLMTSGIRLVVLMVDDQFRQDFFGKTMKAKPLHARIPQPA